MRHSLSGFSVHGIFPARILEWVAMSSSKGSSQPRDWTHVSCIASGYFTCWATGDVAQLQNLLQIRPTLWKLSHPPSSASFLPFPHHVTVLYLCSKQVAGTQFNSCWLNWFGFIDVSLPLHTPLWFYCVFNPCGGFLVALQTKQMHERNGKHPISLNFKCHESDSLSKLSFSCFWFPGRRQIESYFKIDIWNITLFFPPKV